MIAKTKNKKPVANLLKPTEGQIKTRNRLWANALSNSRKTGGKMYDGKGSRCCLAVAQDIAIQHGININKKNNNFKPDVLVSKFFGWGKTVPNLIVNVGGKPKKIGAVDINDGYINFRTIKDQKKGLAHAQIGECVLNTFVRPKSPKFTFSA